MRKTWASIVAPLLLLLTSCSLPDFSLLPAATDTSIPMSPTIVPSPTDTSTITPTQPTPTFTTTPTLFGFKPTATITGTPPTSTPTQTPLPIFFDTPTLLNLTTPQEAPGEGFKSFTLSGNKVFWGICSPGTVNLEAEVLDKDAVSRVYLFMHLKSTKTEDTTPWVGTSMTNHRDGRFTYTLRADLVDGRKNYLRAWLVLQMVAVDDQERVIGRTRIYDQSLTIEPCP
jgi:hypothetical protein